MGLFACDFLSHENQVGFRDQYRRDLFYAPGSGIGAEEEFTIPHFVGCPVMSL